MASNFEGAPKSLLPIPSLKKNLLQKIVEDGLGFFGEIDIHVADHNIAQISSSVREAPEINVKLSNNDCFLRSVYNEYNGSKRVYFAPADFYCDLAWGEFVKFHDSHNLPVSCVASRGAENVISSVVEVENNIAKRWERKLTSKSDFQNVGMYICDPHPEITKFLHALTPAKDSEFEKILVSSGLLGCISSPNGFNVNDERAYNSMLDALDSTP